MRDLTRARETAVIDLRSKRQQVSAFLLRQGRWYPAGKKTWTNAHMNWLASQKFEQPERRIVFEEMMFAIRQAQERVERLELLARDHGCGFPEPGCEDLSAMAPGRDRRYGAARQQTKGAAENRLAGTSRRRPRRVE